MQIKIFTLPIFDSELMEEEVNKFLRSHRVMTVDRHFSSENGGYWTLFVSYQDGAASSNVQPVSRGGKVDYRDVLSPEEFGRFARYRDVRKELSTKLAVPAYAVFTDEELSQMARMQTVTISGIAAIKTVGKRAEKYGEYFVKAFNAVEDETS